MCRIPIEWVRLPEVIDGDQVVDRLAEKREPECIRVPAVAVGVKMTRDCPNAIVDRRRIVTPVEGRRMIEIGYQRLAVVFPKRSGDRRSGGFWKMDVDQLERHERNFSN